MTSPSSPPPDALTHPVLAPVHDFARKLRQEAFLPRVRAYVAWRRSVLQARAAGRAEPALPPWAPLSINLDLTTACNYACDHCVDWDILGRRVSYDEAHLHRSLETLARLGLRSVILIGGGEPTVHAGFGRAVRLLKDLGLHVGIVTNGSLGGRILDVMDVLEACDWIRLSLDAGTDETFQVLHRPKKAITLEAICAGVRPWRARNPAPRVGFSFVVTWKGAQRAPGEAVVENLHEIVPAARLARRSGFDYVSYKPFLVRTPDGAEVVDPGASLEGHADVVGRIRDAVEQAKTLGAEDFAVLESTNLKLLEAGTWREWTRQPRTCHMQVFRQVLSPVGLFNCPAHRGVDAARIAGRDAFADSARADATAGELTRLLDAFDASARCRDVTCLYHDANAWLEAMVVGPGGLDAVQAEPDDDFFL